MSLVLYIFTIAALILAVGLSGGWYKAPAPRPMVFGLAAAGAWLEFFCILYVVVSGHGALPS